MNPADLLKIGTFILDIRKNFIGKDQKLVVAITALRKAIRETRTHIDSKGYNANSGISDLWLDAYRLCQEARLKNRMLYDKARFWEDPQTWLAEPGSLELVPTLKQLEQECENLLVKIA